MTDRGQSILQLMVQITDVAVGTKLPERALALLRRARGELAYAHAPSASPEVRLLYLRKAERSMSEAIDVREGRC